MFRLPSFFTAPKSASTEIDDDAPHCPNSSRPKPCTGTSSFGSAADNPELLRRHNKSLYSKKATESSSLADLSIAVESPPLICHGSPDKSSGALFAGQLHVNVLSETTIFDVLEVRLFRIITTKNPSIGSHCEACMGSREELRKWDFNAEPVSLAVGNNNFLFNHVFAGDSPASTCSDYAMIDYQFVAIARSSSGESITHCHLVKLQRALRPDEDMERADEDIATCRLFPPTNIMASITFSPICTIGQELPISLQLSSVQDASNSKPKTHWRLGHLRWHVEETQEMETTTSCPKHRHKASEQQKSARQVVSGQRAWKLGDTMSPIAKTGSVDADFSVKIDARERCIPDVQAAHHVRLDVRHRLVVDLIVREEFANARPAARTYLTGDSRTLRMEFPLGVTMDVGTAVVAWDEEIPPVYQEAIGSPSPPTY